MQEDVIPMDGNEEISAQLLKQRAIESFLQLKGIGKDKAEKLYDAGYVSLTDIAVSSVGDFVERTNFSKKASETVINNAKGLVHISEMKSATEKLKEETMQVRLSSGNADVDDMIGGGYATGLITELYGENGSGKTQTCMTSAVMATFPIEEGGLDSDVIYVDTEGTFRAQRVAQIAEARGKTADEVLSRIYVVRVHSTSDMMLQMDKIREKCAETKVRLLIVDSIISHFRSEFCGRGALAERQQLLNRYLGELIAFSEANDAVVLVSNQVMSNPDQLFGDPTKAVGGNILGHACAYRIYIRKGRQGKRVFRLSKAPDCPEGEAVVTVGEQGIY